MSGKRFTEEFKKEAVKQVTERGYLDLTSSRDGQHGGLIGRDTVAYLDNTPLKIGNTCLVSKYSDLYIRSFISQ